MAISTLYMNHFATSILFYMSIVNAPWMIQIAKMLANIFAQASSDPVFAPSAQDENVSRYYAGSTNKSLSTL